MVDLKPIDTGRAIADAGDVKRAIAETDANRYTDDIEAFMWDVLREVLRAKKMFPGNKHQTTVFFEEAGEVAKAFLEYDEGKETAEGVYTECVQAAAMAAVLAVEGSEGFSYKLASVTF